MSTRPLLIKNVCAVAGDVGRPAGHNLAEVVLSDDLDGKMVFVDVDVGMRPDSLDKTLLYLVARVVGVVEYTEFRMSALAVKVEIAFFVLVEIDTPADKLFDLGRRALDDHLDGSRVAEPVARDHRVMDMFIEIINLEICHRSDTALCQSCVGFIESRFTYQRHTACTGHFKRKTHAGDAGAYHKIVIFLNHGSDICYNALLIV